MLKSEIEFLKHINKKYLFILKNSFNLTEDNFYQNEIIQRAFIRSLEIIGEVAKKINYDFRIKYAEIP